MFPVRFSNEGARVSVASVRRGAPGFDVYTIGSGAGDLLPVAQGLTCPLRDAPSPVSGVDRILLSARGRQTVYESLDRALP